MIAAAANNVAYRRQVDVPMLWIAIPAIQNKLNGYITMVFA